MEQLRHGPPPLPGALSRPREAQSVRQRESLTGPSSREAQSLDSETDMEEMVSEGEFLQAMAPLLARFTKDTDLSMHALARAEKYYDDYVNDRVALNAVDTQFQYLGLDTRATSAAQRLFINFLRTLAQDTVLAHRAEAAYVLEDLERLTIINELAPRLDALKNKILYATETEDMRRLVVQYLDGVTRVGELFPPEDPRYKDVWDELVGRFRFVPRLKDCTDKATRFLLEGVLEDYVGSTVAYKAIEQATAKGYASGSVEHATHHVFNRNKQEVQAIKERNRQLVTMEIQRSVEAGEDCSIELLERLHRINNAGLIAERMSQHRGRRGSEVQFGARVGTLSAQVQQELQAVVDRANKLYESALLKSMSYQVYEIAVAKLHNDLLDIHPFPDRNGSTSMLFMEWMLAKRHHYPSPKREDEYYEHLSKVFPVNVLARGVVAMQHVKTAKLSGYYKGVTHQSPEVDAQHRAYAAQRTAYRQKIIQEYSEEKKREKNAGRN